MQQNQIDDSEILKNQGENKQQSEQNIFNETFDQTIQQQSLDQVVLRLIYTITEDILVTKEKIIYNENEIDIPNDEVVEMHNLDNDVKKEIIVNINRDQLEKCQFIKSLYPIIKEVVKLPICIPNGLHLPNPQEIFIYFKATTLKVDELQKQLNGVELQHLYSLLICSLIFKEQNIEQIVIDFLLEQLTLEICLKLLAITTQYESKYSLTLYKLFKHLYYFQKGLIKEDYDTLIQTIIQNGMKPKQLQIEKPNFIKVISTLHIFKLNTTFLYPFYKQNYNEILQLHRIITQPKRLKLTRNFFTEEGDDQSAFPHQYHLWDEENKTILIAIQQQPFGEIQIFLQSQEKPIKYNDSYLGYIEYKQNLWIAYDDGYTEYLENYIPQWIGKKRRKILSLNFYKDKRYDKPKLFDVHIYNENNNQEFLTQEAKYDENKASFSLPLGDLAEIPSTRNYILKSKDTEEICLKHGKSNRHTFNIELLSGMSLFHGLCISIMSICSK